MRCFDRKCRGRVHLNIELDKRGTKKYTDPTLVSKCTIEYSEHSWVKNEKISRDIDEKKIKTEDWKRRSVQMIFFEKKMQGPGGNKNVDLIKSFINENPQADLKVNSRDITIISQNMKRKALESHKAVDRLDNILGAAGQPLLVEKV